MANSILLKKEHRVYNGSVSITALGLQTLNSCTLDRSPQTAKNEHFIILWPIYEKLLIHFILMHIHPMQLSSPQPVNFVALEII